MAEVLYVGPRSPLAAAAAKLVRKRGHTFATVRPTDAMRRLQRGDCRAIVVCWTAGQMGLAVARTAKKLGIPVIVVSRRLVRAFRVFKSLADVFLEQPAHAEEVATLAVELLLRTQPAGVSEAFPGPAKATRPEGPPPKARKAGAVAAA